MDVKSSRKPKRCQQVEKTVECLDVKSSRKPKRCQKTQRKALEDDCTLATPKSPQKKDPSRTQASPENQREFTFEKKKGGRAHSRKRVNFESAKESSKISNPRDGKKGKHSSQTGNSQWSKHTAISLEKISISETSPCLLLPGTLEKEYVLLLIDSGPNANFVPQDMMSKGKNRTKKLSKKATVSLADQRKITIERKARLRIQVSTMVRRVTFFVIAGIKDPILGMPFLETSKAKIDFSERTIELPSWKGGVTRVTDCNVVNFNPENFQETSRQTGSPRQTVQTVELKKAEIEDILRVSEHHETASVKSAELMQDHKSTDFEDFIPDFTLREKFEFPDEGNLTAKEKSVLRQFKEVFEPLPRKLPPRRSCDHEIKLQEAAKPVYCQPFRLSDKGGKVMEDPIQDLLERGWIRSSKSPWSSPAFMVKKHDTTELRMCIDYRRLNQHTIADPYPLPLVDRLLERASKGNFYTKFDLKSGYWQIRVKEGDEAKTGFCTPQGHFEWLVLPFGCCNAPRTFQREMDRIFGSSSSFVVVFQDDILVFSETREKHIEDVAKVLEKLKENFFHANPKKCKLFQTEISFCGHILSAGCVKPQTDKIIALKGWPTPTNVKEVRRFLGFVAYYQKFIKGFAQLAAPLTSLLKKGCEWRWSTQEGESMRKLIEALSSDVTIKYPVPNFPFIIESDASNIACGAVLYQEQPNGDLRPVAFRSRKLNQHEKNYSTHRKELLSVVDALKTWRHWLHLDYHQTTVHSRTSRWNQP